MFSDIEIAQGCTMLPITQIAEKLELPAEHLELYGNYKAKISESLTKSIKNKPNGKLVLVTAINPTPAGEGKTTTTVAIGQAMGKLGKKAIVTLREPSLGPIFGIKGGAAGGGYSQVVPMEDINLHFTGDMHAITSANNLLCAAVDNHIHQGNSLKIDVRRIIFPRVLDMNDRSLRNIIVGLGGKVNGVPREDSFTITVASEVMAILCLASNISDLKYRLGNILVGYNMEDKPVYCRDVGVQGAMAALLKDALKPNLVQTLEQTPAIVHGGPFANIAHGCNSIKATWTALKIADYCITEAGFGSDLGAEKFMNIKCRDAGFSPDCIVLVATVRALKYNGGIAKQELFREDIKAVQSGLCNLEKHIENLRKFGVPIVVAINKFGTDTEAEINAVRDFCKLKDVPIELCKGFEKGGKGAVDLAEKIIELADNPKNFRHLYSVDESIKDKISTIATEIYGAKDVTYSPKADREIANIEKIGRDNIPICMAKTQYSLSDNPALLGKPSGFILNIRDIKICSGAGFIVAYAGDVMTMPGLPAVPSANKIDIEATGKITGLF